MLCPYCSKALTNVIRTDNRKTISKVFRYRKCPRCKFLFTTQEIPHKLDERMMRFIPKDEDIKEWYQNKKKI